jgi:hypothetical protein
MILGVITRLQIYEHILLDDYICAMNQDKEISHAIMRMAARHVADIMQTFPDIMEAMQTKTFRAVETGVHAKTLADWNRLGLLLSDRNPKKHHRFNLSEFVWVLLVDRMRAFNLPFDFIASFREECVQIQPLDLEALLSQPGYIEEMSKMIPGVPREWVTNFLSDPNSRTMLAALMKDDLPSLNLFDIMVMLTLFLGSSVSIIVDEKGQGTLFYPELLNIEVPGQPGVMDILSRTHISISLSEIVAKTLGTVPVEKVTDQLKLLSHEEAEVLQAVRAKGVKAVTVRLDDHGEVDFLELTTVQNADRGTRLLELMLREGYHDITVKTERGKVVHCENTRKIKFK